MNAPIPWRVSESNGGKFFMYDANNKVIIVPNVSSTGRSQDELVSIYRMIVQAVNELAKRQAEEQAAWEEFDNRKSK